MPPIRREAFRPNRNDDTGISVFRALFAEPADIVANIAPEKQNEYVVASISVADLKKLGLTVVADPEPDGPAGHAIIPELSLPVYDANKAHCKEIAFKLATLASAAIVDPPS